MTESSQTSSGFENDPGNQENKQQKLEEYKNMIIEHRYEEQCFSALLYSFLILLEERMENTLNKAIALGASEDEIEQVMTEGIRIAEKRFEEAKKRGEEEERRMEEEEEKNNQRI